jgi:hypothetical protein
MTAAEDKLNRPAEEDEDIILLTEVVEEPPREVVLDISAGKQGLGSPFQGSPLQAILEKPASGGADDDLSDFLASLKDLPQDLDIPAPLPATPQGEPEAAAPVDLLAFLGEARLKELLQEVVQETVAKLTQELAPQIIGEILDRKIDAWRQRQAEEE